MEHRAKADIAVVECNTLLPRYFPALFKPHFEPFRSFFPETRTWKRTVRFLFNVFNVKFDYNFAPGYSRFSFNPICRAV